MTTVPGMRSRITVTSGTRPMFQMTGPHTVTVIGAISVLGAGLGWTTSLGALHPSTMAAGLTSGRWGWCPGPIIGPAIYGPAFVGFVGGGFGFGLDVGWFPLGFGEPFNPWFNCGPSYIERVNVRNTFI